MTALDEALRALENKWRDESNRRQESAGEMENDEPQDAAWNSGIAAGLDECADELAALLSSRQEVAPVAARVAKDGSNKVAVLLSDLPVGTPLYTSTSQASEARDAKVAELIDAAEDVVSELASHQQSNYCDCFGETDSAAIERAETAIAAMRQEAE